MAGDREIFFRHLGLPSPLPMGIEITNAKGIYLYGSRKKKYVDLVSGVSVSNAGHRNQKVIEAIKDQVDKHLHLMVYGEIIQAPQVRLAKALCEQLPGKMNSVYFVNSGSEAIEGAMKLSKRYTGRSEIIAFKNAYHGGTQGALSILGNESLKNAFRPLIPGIRLIDFNDFNSLTSITRNTAAVFTETIQAEAGIRLPEKGFMEALASRCKQTGTLLVVDDIQMGMGRTGKLFSIEHFNIEPDIICLAKALGGGMPLGAFISSRQMMKALAFDPELGHITTFGGHPVSCAAGLASLKFILDSGLHNKAQSKGDLFFKLLKDHREIREIRYKGLMMAVELQDGSKMKNLQDNFLEKGIIVDRFLFNHGSFRIAPPLIITKKQIHEISGIILGCLDGLR